MTIYKSILIIFSILFVVNTFAKSPMPCSGVDRTLSDKEKSRFKQG